MIQQSGGDSNKRSSRILGANVVPGGCQLIGHVTPEQRTVSGEQFAWGWDWDRGSPRPGLSALPTHQRLSSLVDGLQQAEQGDGRRRARGLRGHEQAERRSRAEPLQDTGTGPRASW